MSNFELATKIGQRDLCHPSKKVQHKLYDLDRILKGQNLEDDTIREEVHASILKNVCGK